MLEILLVANAIWFGLGFHLFTLRSKIFGKILVSREHRDTPAFDVLVESGKFLGGFNFALCVFNVALVLKLDAFPTPEQRILLFLFFALAHGSQFFFNVPIALANLKGQGVWQVKGLMRFIFVTDFILMMANFAAAAAYLA